MRETMETEKKGILERIGQIDQRILYWLLASLLILPYLVTVGFPLPLSPMTQEFYNYIDELEPGSVVLYSSDSGPGGLPEMEGSIVAVSRHLASKDLKVIIIAVWTPAAALVNDEKISGAFRAVGKEYGVDYVNCGFLPGGEGAVATLANDFSGLILTDYYGTPMTDLPIMDGIHNAEDFDLIIANGFPDWLYMRQDWVPKFERTLISMKSAGGATEIMGMYPHQTKAILGGARAGAEYEVLIKQPGVAKKGIESLTFGVIAFVVFIVLGNVSYVAYERGK